MKPNTKKQWEAIKFSNSPAKPQHHSIKLNEIDDTCMFRIDFFLKIKKKNLGSPILAISSEYRNNPYKLVI